MRRKFLFKIFILASLIFCLATPSYAGVFLNSDGDDHGKDSIENQNDSFDQGSGFTYDVKVEDIVGPVVDTFFNFLGIIFIILMVYSGYTYMIAKGDEEKVTKALDSILRAIIGLVITLGAFAIWNFVFDNLISK